jgi:hypothetical protein
MYRHVHTNDKLQFVKIRIGQSLTIFRKLFGDKDLLQGSQKRGQRATCGPPNACCRHLKNYEN